MSDILTAEEVTGVRRVLDAPGFVADRQHRRLIRDLMESHEALRAALTAAEARVAALTETLRVLYTALERSAPADPGHGEIQFRKQAMADTLALLAAAPPEGEDR